MRRRTAQANGASVRNFGFITVTGQSAGAAGARARRSGDLWAEIAPKAGIAVEHEGVVVLARRPEAAAVLDAFARTDRDRTANCCARMRRGGDYPTCSRTRSARRFGARTSCVCNRG